jgi:phage gpG-like protein
MATIKGAVETQRKMEQVVADLTGPPVLQAFRDATLLVSNQAKINAPVDTGRLRASITPEVRVVGNTIQGVVGSNVIYAAAMELGTRPHWPPRSALETWARRHGLSVFVVQRAIARKGTKPRRYLQRAFESNRPLIIRKIERAVTQVVDK